MSKRDDLRIVNLVKKNVAKVNAPKPNKALKSDPTLRIRPELSDETQSFFSEMKKREF
jgi:hypothetical protein